MQELDLWTGKIHSSMKWEGVEITVSTTVHPQIDALGVKISSPLLQSRRLSVFLTFPFSDGRSKFSTPYCGIWDKPESHTTTIQETHRTKVRFGRRIDDATYNAVVHWNQEGRMERLRDHLFVLVLSRPSEALEFSASFGGNTAPLLSTQNIFNASTEYWPSFWKLSDAIDLSRSSDPRWVELKRRIVLSQYVVAVNATGMDPPQESSLINLGWYGKFHMEMNWWHTGGPALFNKRRLMYPGLVSTPVLYEGLWIVPQLRDIEEHAGRR